MAYSDRPLDNPINWSFRVARLFAIDVRVHVTFLIGAIVLLAMEMPRDDSTTVPFSRILVDAFGTYVILFFIVLLHEFGHCYGARATGGEAEEVLLWPLGGLAQVNPPHTPRAHLLTTLAGPMVNVVICLVAAAVLVAWLGTIGAVPWNPLHPASPVASTVHPTAGQFWVMRVFGISYVLLLLNLAPIFPFDGGRIVQAALWPRKGYRASMEIATSTGMVGAIPVGLFGLLCGEWLLIMIAVFGYITCWQNRRMLREQGEFDAAFGPGFGGGYDGGDVAEPRRRRPGYFERRRQKRAAQRAARERAAAEARSKAVEEALMQVSRAGLGSLTPKQRRLLEEETRRRRDFEANTEDSVSA